MSYKNRLHISTQVLFVIFVAAKYAVLYDLSKSFGFPGGGPTQNISVKDYIHDSCFIYLQLIEALFNICLE